MANASFVWSNFLGGEWSPFAQGRMDQPKYKTALALCLNAYPIEEGALPRRPGFQHAGQTRNGAPGRIIEYVFSETAAFTMEFTDGHLRFRRGANLVTDGVPTSVTSITTAFPAVMTTGASTAWSNGDIVIFTPIGAAAALAVPYLLNTQFSVQGSGSTWSLYDPFTGNPINGATLAWATATFSVAKVLDLATPYVNGSWANTRVVQTDTNSVLLNPAYPAQVLTPTIPVAGGPPSTFTLAAAYLQNGPYLPLNAQGLITPSGTTGSITVTMSYAAYSATTAYKLGDFVLSSGISYQSLIDANVGNTPASSPTDWAVVSAGALWGPNGFTALDIGRSILLNTGGATPTVTWGKITALSSVGIISPSLAGSTNFLSGGFTGSKVSGSTFNTAAAAFDTIVSKPYASCCGYTISANSSGAITLFSLTGKNYSGASAQVVSSALVYPSSDIGFGSVSGGATIGTVTFTLRAGAAAPTGDGQGTLLGTAYASPGQRSPVTIASSSGASWNYVWVEVDAAGTISGAGTAGLVLAQVQFFGSSGAPGTAATVAILGPALPNTSNTFWQAGAYSNVTAWPANGCYHEGRLWLSGAIPNRADSSNSNQPFVFAPSSSAGVVGDSNSISGTFNSAEVNPIFWMAPDLQGIVCGTQEGEYLIQSGTTNTALTPANVQAHLVTKYGCANVEPRKTGLTTMFVQKFGRKLQEYLSDIFSGRFFSPNASQNAQHLTIGGLQEIAYQSGLQNIVWGRTGNGQLIGCTYNRVTLSSTAEPLYQGWHQHTMGSGRSVTSISVGPSTDGELSALTIVTADNNGPYHVEIMRNLFDEEAAMADAWFLDDAIVPPVAASTTVDLSPGLAFYGLSAHEGKQVDAFVAGLDLGTFTVADGSIFVPYSTSNSLFTARYLAELASEGNSYGDTACAVDGGLWMIPAIVGFSFTTKVQLVRPNEPAQTGAQNGPAFGKMQRVAQYAIQMWKAQGISVGTSFSRTHPVKLRTEGGKPIGADQLFSGIVQDTLDDTSSYQGSQLCWEITRPFPATVNAIGGFINTQDK